MVKYVPVDYDPFVPLPPRRPVEFGGKPAPLRFEPVDYDPFAPQEKSNPPITAEVTQQPSLLDRAKAFYAGQPEQQPERQPTPQSLDAATFGPAKVASAEEAIPGFIGAEKNLAVLVSDGLAIFVQRRLFCNLPFCPQSRNAS